MTAECPHQHPAITVISRATSVALISRAADIRAAVAGPPFAATAPTGDADAFEALGLNRCDFLLFFLFHLFLCFIGYTCLY